MKVTHQTIKDALPVESGSGRRSVIRARSDIVEIVLDCVLRRRQFLDIAKRLGVNIETLNRFRARFITEEVERLGWPQRSDDEPCSPPALELVFSLEYLARRLELCIAVLAPDFTDRPRRRAAHRADTLDRLAGGARRQKTAHRKAEKQAAHDAEVTSRGPSGDPSPSFLQLPDFGVRGSRPGCAHT